VLAPVTGKRPPKGPLIAVYITEAQQAVIKQKGNKHARKAQ